MRRDYVVVVEIVTLAPLSHGAGADGNVSIARTTEVLLNETDPDTGKTSPVKVKVPMVSGASFRSTLREHAFGHMAEVLGLQDGAVSLDALRLLLKGGKNDSGGATVSLEEARRLRDLFPMLAVWGSMDGGLPIRGELQVSQVLPWCTELLDAGMLSRSVSSIDVSVDGASISGAPSIAVFEDRAPVPLHMLLTEEEYFRHDMRTSPHVKLLGGAQQAAIEDKAAARKGHVAGKDERRAANESMPYTHEAICTGAPLVGILRLQGATEVEFECLVYALSRWMAAGAILGGASSKGHGRCAVTLRGAVSHIPSAGETLAPEGTAISLDKAGDAYLRHVRERQDAMRTELAKVKRGEGAEPKPAKPAKGKKSKVAAMPDEADVEAEAEETA